MNIILSAETMLKEHAQTSGRHSYSVTNYLVMKEDKNRLLEKINPLTSGNFPVYLLSYRHRSFLPSSLLAASPNQDCAIAMWIAAPGNAAASGAGIQK